MTEVLEIPAIRPDELPRPSILSIGCPLCGMELDYEVEETEEGAFVPAADWPVCTHCDILVDVPAVEIVKAFDIQSGTI